MIFAYVPRDACVDRVEIFGGQPLPADALWFDLFNPTDEERARVEAALAIALPTREEMREIEPSSRFYVENGAIYMTATVLNRADDPNPSADPFTFVLARRALATLRYVDPKPVATFTHRISRQAHACGSGEEALIGLLEAFIDRIADILERMSIDLDAISRSIFDDRYSTSPRRDAERRDLQLVLKQLGRTDDLATTARESVHSITRMTRFFGSVFEVETKKETKDIKARLKALARDMESLAEHASFETGKVNFLLNATLGMINIEQNRIIKLFSVAAVVFLPPTLVASIYGMNFQSMPELKWSFGYAWAICLMIISAVVPYVWFKRKGWF
jgi:magnesium transporter